MAGDVFEVWPVELVPLDRVTPHPENYRDHDLGAIAHSIKLWGVWRALVVQKSTGLILVGNGEWKALGMLQPDEWPADLPRGMVPVRWLDVDDDNARAILLADNWIPSRGRNMPSELLSLMRELAEDRDLFEAAGIDESDVDAIIREVEDEAGDGPPLEAKAKKKPAPKPRKVECPECGHKFTVGPK